LPALLLAASSSSDSRADEAGFMHLARLLIPHRLDALTGRRLMAALSVKYPSLHSQVATLLALAIERQANEAEDFLPFATQNAKNVALAIISGWYLGFVQNGPTTQVLAYDQALMFGPTSDVMTIPTYATAGPNEWGSASPPVAFMPSF
jgi:hypothetical protein